MWRDEYALRRDTLGRWIIEERTMLVYLLEIVGVKVHDFETAWRLKLNRE